MKTRRFWSIVLVLSLSIVGFSASSEEPESSENTEEVIEYEITEHVLKTLQEKDVSQEVLVKLEGLKNHIYSSEDAFVSAVEKAIGKGPTKTYQAFIVDAARQKFVFQYNPAGRREPFRSLLKPVPENGWELIPPGPCEGDECHPLIQFELNQLRLTGIILLESGGRARVLAPDGKSYTIVVGSLIGTYRGKVTSISNNCVVVREMRSYKRGEETKEEEAEFELCLNPLEKE